MPNYLFSPVHTWSPQVVFKWMSGLHPLAEQHANVMLHHNVTGAILTALTWNDLDNMKITGVYDQESILSSIAILNDVDTNNKQYLVFPLAERVYILGVEALEHIDYLKICRNDTVKNQELFMCCIKMDRLIRSLLIYIDRYSIEFAWQSNLVHELQGHLYTLTYTALQLKATLRASGIVVPNVPMDLQENNKRKSFSPCLTSALKSLLSSADMIRKNTDISGVRGCPAFERITLHPDGDIGWGFSFRETSSGIYIIKRILTNTPADKSGRIKSGDEVIEVNNQNIVGWKIKNVVELIRSHPTGLVMVVRHYPDNLPIKVSSRSTSVHLSPNQSPTSGRSPINRRSPLSGRSPSATPNVSPSLSTSPLPSSYDTPKKPPRPLDSVLRERCKSNNELDQHFKTVHNPKRLSQIYGDNDLCKSEGHMRSNVTPVALRKFSNSSNTSPISFHRRRVCTEKYNTVSCSRSTSWYEQLRTRSEFSSSPSTNFSKYGTGPRIRPSGRSLNFTNMSMPDIAISTENIAKVDKSTETLPTLDTMMDDSNSFYSNSDITCTDNANVSYGDNSTDTVMEVATTPTRNNIPTNPQQDLVNNLNTSTTDKKINNMDKFRGTNSSECDGIPMSTSKSMSSSVSNLTTNTMETTDSSRSKTLPRRLHNKENVGEIKNYPMSKESNYSACVIGGVVHKIPMPTAATPEKPREDTPSNPPPNSYDTGTKTRKRQNKRSSWSITIDKSATLPKNLRFSSLVELEENGTLRKKKNKKPSRSTSAIIGDVNVSCNSLYPNACEGWLHKLGGSGLTPKNWRRRWFVLKGFCLYYFKTPQDSTALGVITLPSFNISNAPEIKKKFCFKAYHKNTRTYYFVADSDAERQRWMDKMLLASILYDESDRESGYGTGASPVATDICSLSIEHTAMSPCSSIQSIASTTVV